VFIGSPASSVSTLSHTAILIVQYLQRGLSLHKAFFEACWEVYVCSQHSAANQKVLGMFHATVQVVALRQRKLLLWIATFKRVDCYFIPVKDLVSLGVGGARL
jgi:hypothetical protein